MGVTHFNTQDLPATPWKNGGGSTREILCWPPGASFEDFDWRVSLASIDASGPFSVFAGVDRCIMLISGAGVHLQGEGVDHSLTTPHRPFDFSGDLPLLGHLLGEHSTDFNVMSRRARGHARVQVLRAHTELPAHSHGLLLSLYGSWQAGAHRLNAGDGLWWAGAPQGWSLVPQQPDAALVAVHWQPTHPESD